MVRALPEIRKLAQVETDRYEAMPCLPGTSEVNAGGLARSFTEEGSQILERRRKRAYRCVEPSVLHF
jgi:hypothetical protein